MTVNGVDYPYQSILAIPCQFIGTVNLSGSCPVFGFWKLFPWPTIKRLLPN